jgi:DNA-binding response OmpR family regulator
MAPGARLGENPILLVEDEPDDVEFLQRAFSLAGVTRPLVVFDNTKASIEYLAGEGQYADRKKHPLPRLVMVDLRLVGTPGHEVIAWMRARRAFDGTKIIVLSSLYDEGHRREAYRLGANSYLVKSTSFEELCAKVKNIAENWLGPE